MIRRRKNLNLSVGNDAPRKPAHSLPSYNEPTPETRRKLTREEEAEIALLNTSFSPAARALLIALFLSTIAIVPLLQLFAETNHFHPNGRLPMFDLLKIAPTWEQLSAVRTASSFWNLLPHPTEIKAREKTLERDSVVSQALLPRMQTLLTGAFGAGNEQVYIGREGWLFYRPDVDFVIGAPFLAPAQLRARRLAANVQPDPIPAIIQFHDQLAARGIELVVMPLPVKSQIESGMLAGGHGPLRNASFENWKQRLDAGGVRVFDPVPLLGAKKSAAPETALYLRTDSHWTPATMEFVVENLAQSIALPSSGGGSTFNLVSKSVVANGDISAMLKLPADQRVVAPEEATIHEISRANAPWRSSTDADVLLLGDSFANIYSLAGMGWGESAGMAEHLSRALGGRPLDCIVRNSDGAFATREILQHELARGRDRLAGKKLVIWEFAARELSVGDWKMLDLKLGKPAPSRFLALQPGEQRDIAGTVAAVSSVPRAGSVPYKDHVMALHIVDIDGATDALVYAWSMRDNVWTSAARIRPGDRISLRVRAWNDVAAEIEKYNRSELDDPAAQMEEPVWAELIR